MADVILAERPLSYQDFSEVYIPVMLGRKGIGFELKPSYFRQAVKNVQAALDGIRFDMQTADLFDEEVAA